ncbi:MAG: N-ethylammeline chlorohydrolase, partial [Candidatus Methanomethylicota archaeon]
MAKSAVTMSELGVIRDAAIVVEEGEVIEVGRQSQLKSKYPRYEKVDASNCVVIPGLINAHTHMAMSLLRGYADDLMLHEWLEKWIWPLESKMSSRDIYVGALLASVEAVKMGTTTVNTMYHYNPDYNEAKAILEVGL